MRRCCPSHSLSDGVRILEISCHGRDPFVQTDGPTAETDNFPAIVEEAAGEVTSADAGDADDKRASCHREFSRTQWLRRLMANIRAVAPTHHPDCSSCLVAVVAQ